MKVLGASASPIGEENADCTMGCFRDVVGKDGERRPCMSKYAVFCMEPAGLSVIFAYIPVHGTTQSRTFGAASFYIYKPPALAGV
jgi:hypothetical protein